MPSVLKPGWVLPVAGVALTWVVLFELNIYWFEFLAISPYVGWVFLPAAVRVLAVLLFRWRGVCGLFLGAMTTNAGLLKEQAFEALALSGVSALAPGMAWWLGIRWLKLTPTLTGFNGWQLLGLSCLAAACSSLMHNVVFYWFRQDHHGMGGIVPMTVGDFVGTLIVLYTAYFVMRWFQSTR